MPANTDNIIRFGKAKKALKRQCDEQQAAENRAKFGRTKAAKQRDTITASHIKAKLDQARRDKNDTSEPTPRKPLI